MKKTIKYPLSKKARWERNITRHRGFAQCQNSRLRFFHVFFYSLGIALSGTGVFFAGRALFFSNYSISDAFNSILFLLTGLIVIFTANHESFVTKQQYHQQSKEAS
jgi:hypothetical protein